MPIVASTATAADASPDTIWPISRTRLRSTASDITPAKAPSSSMGNVRAAETTATARPDPVASSVKSAADSTSNQRIVLTQPPIAHRRRKVAEDRSAEMPHGRPVQFAGSAAIGRSPLLGPAPMDRRCRHALSCANGWKTGRGDPFK